MQVQVHADRNIEGHQKLVDHVTGVVEQALERFADHVTRVEVHLTDENAHKSGAKDKRCVMEARLERHAPVAVTHHAATLHQAVQQAAGKLTRLLENTFGRLHDQRRHRTDPLPEGDEA